MATSRTVTEELEEGDLISPTVLGEVVHEIVRRDAGIFSLSGSLLDYKIQEYARILRFQRVDSEIEYKLRIEWGDGMEEGNTRREHNRLKNTFLRAGLVEHANISQVIDRLRQHDDIILGIDTNVLWDCILTSQLLPRIYDKPFPNWILVGIPKLVMAETENSANSKIQHGNHPREGWPNYKGRLAQRGLQELMTLRAKDPDRPGLAVMTIGELSKEHNEIDQRNWKLDSQIRTQFQEFLGNISFHKGTFFLSQDRVNVMMSGTEGADGLYLQKPDIDEFDSGTLTDEEFTILLYELAVQFGGIKLQHTGDDDLQISLNVFWPGKQVSDWRRSRLKITDLTRTT